MFSIIGLVIRSKAGELSKTSSVNVAPSFSRIPESFTSHPASSSNADALRRFLRSNWRGPDTGAITAGSVKTPASSKPFDTKSCRMDNSAPIGTPVASKFELPQNEFTLS